MKGRKRKKASSALLLPETPRKSVCEFENVHPRHALADLEPTSQILLLCLVLAAAVRVYYRERQDHTFSREQSKSLICDSSVMATIEVGTMRNPITEKELSTEHA